MTVEPQQDDGKQPKAARVALDGRGPAVETDGGTSSTSHLMVKSRSTLSFSSGSAPAAGRADSPPSVTETPAALPVKITDPASSLLTSAAGSSVSAFQPQQASRNPSRAASSWSGAGDWAQTAALANAASVSGASAAADLGSAGVATYSGLQSMPFFHPAGEPLQSAAASDGVLLSSERGAAPTGYMLLQQLPGLWLQPDLASLPSPASRTPVLLGTGASSHQQQQKARDVEDASVRRRLSVQRYLEKRRRGAFRQHVKVRRQGQAIPSWFVAKPGDLHPSSHNLIFSHPQRI